MASCNQYYIGALVGRLETVHRTSVFAGHFFWDASALQSPHVLARQPQVRQTSPPPFSCFVMVREPVARYQSCYTERFQKAIKLPLDRLPLDKLHDVLANQTEHTRGIALHQGCNNEIARWISPTMGWGDAHADHGELSREAVDETKRRLSACTIGDVTARPTDTLRVLRHWHPWLAPHYKAHNTGHRSSHSKTLPPATVAAIRRANAVDIELYDFAMARFDLLLQSIP